MPIPYFHPELIANVIENPVCCLFASLLGLFLCFTPCLASERLFTSDEPRTFQSMRDTLLNLGTDSASCRSVGGIVFEDGPITISLDSGTFVFLERYEGRRVSALFMGSGTVTFFPGYKTEITNLRRFYHADVYTEEFEKAVFVFTDNQFPAQFAEFSSQPIEKAKDGFAQLNTSATEFMSENDRTDLDGALARCLLTNEKAPIFYAQVWKARVHETVVAHDAYEYEPYRLIFKNLVNGPSSMTFVNQCPAPSGWPILSDDGVDPADQVSTQKHTLTCMIDRGLDMTNHDRINMTVQSDQFTVAAFIPYVIIKRRLRVSRNQPPCNVSIKGFIEILGKATAMVS